MARVVTASYPACAYFSRAAASVSQFSFSVGTGLVLYRFSHHGSPAARSNPAPERAKNMCRPSRLTHTAPDSVNARCVSVTADHPGPNAPLGARYPSTASLELTAAMLLYIRTNDNAPSDRSFSSSIKFPFATFTGSKAYPLVGFAPNTTTSGICNFLRPELSPACLIDSVKAASASDIEPSEPAFRKA